MEFKGPIPGQSLTDTPGNAPWERPPRFSNAEDALQMHLENYSKPEVEEAIVGMLDSGMDIQTITQGVLRNAVAAGQHNIDVGMVIAPILHEYVRGTAEALGVKYDDGFGDKEELKKMRKAGQVGRLQRLLNTPEKDEMPQEEPAPTPMAGEGEGLVARRRKVE